MQRPSPRFGAWTGIVLMGALLASCSHTRRPDGHEGLLPVGSQAPDLTGVNASGERIRLSSVRGHPAVVYFYPKDGTPGCTKQACAYRDTWQRFEREGIAVFGVSRDSAESHRAFRHEHHLPFPLVSDESGEVARAYGVPSRFGMNARTTFLVDRRGKIAHVYENVDPAVDAERVLAAAASLGDGGD